MRRQKLILIGGGGHCRACIDVIEHTDCYDVLGIIDSSELVGNEVLGYKIIGTDNDILKFKNEGCHFLITVGQIKSASVRKKIYKLLEENGAPLATIISPKAQVSKHAKIGRGTIVMHGVMVNASARVGENCIVNTSCIIEHEAIIGNHTHISTSAVVNGNCKIGDEVFIGSNVTVSNQLHISNGVVIGAGGVVIKSIVEPGIYFGNPINKIK